jgi:hypothetical protein
LRMLNSGQSPSIQQLHLCVYICPCCCLPLLNSFRIHSCVRFRNFRRLNLVISSGINRHS